MNSLVGFAPLLARRSKGVSATLALSLIAAGAGFALLGVSGWFLTGAALTTAGAMFNLFGPSSLVRAFSFLRIGARYGEKLVGHDLTLGLLADIREQQFVQLIPRVPFLGGAWRHGDLVSRLVADVDALDAVFITAIGPGFTMLAVGVALSLTLTILAPSTAIVFAVGFAAAALAVPMALVVVTRKIGVRVVEAKAALRITVLDGVEGHADIVAFGRAQDAEATVGGRARRLARAVHRQNQFGAAANAAVPLLAGATALGVFVAGLQTLREDLISAPLLIGLVLATFASFETVALVVRNASRFAAASASAERLRALASAPPAAVEPRRPLALPKGGDICFENIWFSHRRERGLLRGIDLDCPEGSRTAIVGESGCGKSTLLDLALRLLEPQSGRICVAAAPVCEVAQKDLHARVALMSQSTPVFLGTLRDNLQLGQPGASDETLWKALADVGLAPFVAGLPDQLSTWCGEGGRTLSGGQARRLCLARVLLTPATILLLDEPTSGLDRASETAFFETLSRATSGRTVLLVTHAALPERTVDRRFRLEDGVVTRLPE